VGIPDPRWGEMVCAAVERLPGCGIAGAELMKFSTTQLASYKCPKFIRFVEAFPRTASGKIKRHDVGESLCAGKNAP
jgi:acyl-CoA synthetase (AMP-forming)/AMP-acid ligase II